MNQLSLLTPDQSEKAQRGDIVVDVDSRTLHIKINDGDCRCHSPSPYNSSIYNCCWLSLRQLDMKMMLEERIQTGGVSIKYHPDIMALDSRIISLNNEFNNHRSRQDDIYEELCTLKQQCKEQQALMAEMQRQMPTKVAIVEDGERKLQLQQQ